MTLASVTKNAKAIETKKTIARLLHTQLKKSDLVCTQGFINGKWQEAESQRHFVVKGTLCFFHFSIITKLKSVLIFEMIS
jgi:hypothetical protein